MRIHLRFLKKDPDLCKWRHSVSGKMLNFYINNILNAEVHNRIAYVPQNVLLSMDESPCDVAFFVQTEEVETFIAAIPRTQRNAVIKEIIRKHLRAQSDIKAKTTNPFAKDFQMTPMRESAEIILSVPIPVRQIPVKQEKATEPKVSEPPASEPPLSKPQEVREETDEEREMRMALIAMAGE